MRDNRRGEEEVRLANHEPFDQSGQIVHPVLELRLAARDASKGAALRPNDVNLQELVIDPKSIKISMGAVSNSCKSKEPINVCADAEVDV